MKHIRSILVMFAAMGLVLVAFAVAQTSKTNKRQSHTKTVTGCLQKGDEANEYSITDTDGKTYGLRSSSVKLADHLGHKVTVTGRLSAEEEENEANEANEQNEKNEKKEAGDIRVTKLKMVSTSCQ